MKQFKLAFLILITISPLLNAQRLLKITVNNNGKSSYLTYILRNRISYVPSKEIAELLSGGYYYNSDAAKSEIKFANYKIKFTARSQYIIITPQNNKPTIIQLPLSALLINNDVFLPLLYCTEYLGLASGHKLIFNEKAKDLIISNEPLDNESLSLFEESILDTVSKKEKIPNEINSKYDIYDIKLEEKINGTLIRLKTSRKISLPSYSINDGILYIFFSKASIAPNIINSVNKIGLINNAKLKAFSSGNFQLEFGLKEGYSSVEAFEDVENSDILITIHNKLFNTVNELEEAKAKWTFDAVVIDAGHGGKDPGAIGVTGVKEKNINLGIALKLGKLIESNMKDVKVIYTRKKDEFIELYKRGKIANENGGKLFISIHCNSTPHKPSNLRGFEVYLLRPGKTKEAIAIAEFENSVIKYEDNPDRYQKLTDENFILVSMAHSQYMRYSEKFSDILNQQWEENVDIPSLGIKQAGFYVLVGASMPSVLIESGFLSNRSDEKFLKSYNGQMKIAKAIFNALKKYRSYYNNVIQEGR
ncbi:N-acetylmuramoyl-L-alanine amidase [Melioribacteraceae bacterium 4301-Me]|uniref:N-acetylmuramoyl-L-alanine amidase n=1 Tax=Pyranulibacter aquaticus TaxID=3163344 RepID=UPI00359BDE56